VASLILAFVAELKELPDVKEPMELGLEPWQLKV
jgi:hypothetical protein